MHNCKINLVIANRKQQLTWIPLQVRNSCKKERKIVSASRNDDLYIKKMTQGGMN